MAGQFTTNVRSLSLRRPASAAPRVQEQHARSAATRSDVDEQTSPLLPFASSRTVPLVLARPPDRVLDVLVAQAGQLADITAVLPAQIGKSGSPRPGLGPIGMTLSAVACFPCHLCAKIDNLHSDRRRRGKLSPQPCGSIMDDNRGTNEPSSRVPIMPPKLRLLGHARGPFGQWMGLALRGRPRQSRGMGVISEGRYSETASCPACSCLCARSRIRPAEPPTDCRAGRTRASCTGQCSGPCGR
jgi:hypothetical protein